MPKLIDYSKTIRFNCKECENTGKPYIGGLRKNGNSNIFKCLHGHTKRLEELIIERQID